MKSPKKVETMAQLIGAMRGELEKRYSRLRGTERVGYVLSCMALLQELVKSGMALQAAPLASWKELLGVGAMHARNVALEMGKCVQSKAWETPTCAARKALAKLLEAEAACREACNGWDSDKAAEIAGSGPAAQAEKEGKDDGAEGHVYLTYAEYGDVEYRSFKDMAEGTKAFCDERGIPYPNGGFVDGDYYTSYEDEQAFNDDWVSMRGGDGAYGS